LPKKYQKLLRIGSDMRTVRFLGSFPYPCHA
jgi:hypothetical protein